MAHPAAAATDLVVHRASHEVLHGVSFTLAPGSVTGLFGPSGCGKTTLMRTMVGVQHITSGRLELLGLPAGHPDLRRRVAYTSQSLSIYRDIPVRANVRYFARLHGLPDAAAEEAIAAVDLTPLAGRRVETLSGGEASRASLACALVGRPEVLILDEPTVGLDPLTRESLWSHFRGLAESGTTLLVSSHVMDEATRCDSVLLMRDGRFLADGPMDDLQERTGAPTPEAAFLTLVRAEAGA